jgi:two-component system response regulator
MKSMHTIAKEYVVMLVEDNEDHIELTLSALEEAKIGNNVIVMKDGSEALTYLDGEGEFFDRRKNPLPILIMLDLKMPNVCGKTVLKKLKSDEKLKSIPVVILTSSDLERDMEECYELGANSYIVKPISFGEFVEKVKSIPLYWLLVNSSPGGC